MYWVILAKALSCQHRNHLYFKFSVQETSNMGPWFTKLMFKSVFLKQGLCMICIECRLYSVSKMIKGHAQIDEVMTLSIP